MQKRLMICLVVLAMFCACKTENRKGYYYDNHRFNFVKVAKMDKTDGETIGHPYVFNEPQMGTILKMVEIKKGSAFSDNENEKSVFNVTAINRLTPHIVKAFSEITPKQKIVFSYLVKEPLFVIKNDRLTSGSMWVEDGKLHILFDLLYVKVTGDTDKMGYSAERLAQRARGLRVTLDIQPGQAYGDSTRELLVDVGTAEKIAEEVIKKEAELARRGVDATVKIEAVKDASVKERMRELKTLRKERMITEEEFQQKRKDLLNQL